MDAGVVTMYGNEWYALGLCMCAMDTYLHTWTVMMYVLMVYVCMYCKHVCMYASIGIMYACMYVCA